MRNDREHPFHRAIGAPSAARRLGPYEAAYDTRRGYCDAPERGEPAYTRDPAVVFRGRGERR